ncbi:nuclear pore complex protein Nup54-like, partial [Nothobranchius furzeri]
EACLGTQPTKSLDSQQDWKPVPLLEHQGLELDLEVLTSSSTKASASFSECLRGLFGPQTQQQSQTQPSQLHQQVTALSAPTLLGDERDSILAKWNQLQAYWGTGKGYYSNNNPPVEFTQENSFCRFKAVGYSCIPVSKDEDGLVVLVLNKKEADVRAQQQQLVESLHKVLGSNQTLSVNVDGVKALPNDQTEVIIKKNYTRSFFHRAQLKQLLQNAPAGVDPIIWEQAKVDNPDPERLIPVPMVGFKELLCRLQIQEQMTKQHQTRVDVSKNISAVVSRFRKCGKKRGTRSGLGVVWLSTAGTLGRISAVPRTVHRCKALYKDCFLPFFKSTALCIMAVYFKQCLRFSHVQHLKQQQDGLSHLISVIKEDLEDIKLIEHGLSDRGHTRGGILS